MTVVGTDLGGLHVGDVVSIQIGATTRVCRVIEKPFTWPGVPLGTLGWGIRLEPLDRDRCGACHRVGTDDHPLTVMSGGQLCHMLCPPIP
jgi:hypothetical protein